MATVDERKGEWVTIGQDQAWVAARLERWRTGQDREALGELLKWQRGRAYATALRIVNNEADAEDAVQQACIKILNLRRGFEDAQAFETAVYWAVTQCALNWKQIRKTRQARETAVGYAEQIHEATPLAAAERTENLKALNDELLQLDLRERAAVVLCCQEGLSLTEAAGALEESRETLRDRLSRTLTRLRERLRKKGVDISPLLLIGLLRQSRTGAVPDSLCRGLDQQFPGSSCRTITEAGVRDIPADVLSVAGTASRSGAAILTAAALMLIACAGVGVLSTNKTGSRDPERAEPGKPVAKIREARAVPSNTGVPTNEEAQEVKNKVSMAAAAALVSALGVTASADDGAAGRKEIGKDEIKAAVRAVVANEQKAKSDAKSSDPKVQQVPSLKEFQERD